MVDQMLKDGTLWFLILFVLIIINNIVNDRYHLVVVNILFLLFEIDNSCICNVSERVGISFIFFSISYVALFIKVKVSGSFSFCEEDCLLINIGFEGLILVYYICSSIF